MLRLTCLFLCYFLAFTIYANDATLTSKAFANDVPLPVLYTCDGKDISPDLRWGSLPAKTRSLAIILSDSDAPNGTFYHWIIYNIPSNIQTLPQGVATLPPSSLVGKNSWGKMQYNGPCPPQGSLHHYTFTLYALDKTLNLPVGADAPTLLQAMKGHILKQVVLNTAYARWVK